MFIEKKLKHVDPRLLTVNGSSNGLVQVADARGFFVKQKVYLTSSTQPPLLVEVKRFNGLNSFYVGPLPPDGQIQKRTNISAYLVADGAAIQAEEQDRPGIKLDDIDRAVYAEEPIVAIRTIGVDPDGEYYTVDNPLPVQLSDGSINIGTVNAELEVQLTHLDNYPDVGDIHDSIRIGGTTYEAEVTSDNRLKVEATFDPGSGYPVDVDGVYDVSTNPDPDNIGVIGHTRAAVPGDADQNNRITSITNGYVHAMDVSLHNSDGSAIDSTNPLYIAAIDLDIRDLDASQDNISISDGEDALSINPDGSINVNVVQSASDSETSLNVYGEADAIVAGSETVVVSYTVPGEKSAYLLRGEFSGTQISQYWIYVNGIKIASRRTHHGSGLTGEFTFTGGTLEGLPLGSGDLIELTTLFNRPGTGDFEARLQIIEGESPVIGSLLLEDGSFILLEDSGEILI
jgi:hypothetical protein